MGTVEVARPTRELPPPHAGELALQAPPEPEKVVPGGVLMRLLPLVMLVGSLGFIVVLGVRNPTSWLFGGMFAISTLGMMATGGGAGRRSAHVDHRREPPRLPPLPRPDAAHGVREAAAAQRASAEAVHPDPEAWPAVVAGGRLWERSAADADFGHVRVGRGAQRLATRLIPPETGPVEGLEPVTALALRRFLMAHTVVPDLPVALSLRAAPRSGSNRPNGAGSPARWPGPSSRSSCCGTARPTRGSPWWPHRRRRPSGSGPSGCRTTPIRGCATARARCGCSPPRSTRCVAGGRPKPPATGAAPARRRRRRGRRDGPVGRRPGRHRAAGRGACRATPDAVGGAPAADRRRHGAGGGRRGARGDRRPRPAAVGAGGGVGPAAGALPACGGLRRGRRAGRARVARPARPAAGAGGDRRAARAVAGCCGRPAAGADRRRRARRRRSCWTSRSPPRAAAGRTGCASAPPDPARASCCARSCVGLAATHAPEALNLVLVDFKGGATFLGLAAHAARLGGDHEPGRRAHAGRPDGRRAGRRDHPPPGAAAGGGQPGRASPTTPPRAAPVAELPPLPALLVVVDEFSELLAQRPELIDLMVTIGRLGRSLGLHLLLASQRLDEGQAARAGVAPVVPDRAAHVLGVGVARRARRPGRAPAAARRPARRSSPRAPTSSSGSAPRTCPVRREATRAAVRAAGCGPRAHLFGRAGAAGRGSGTAAGTGRAGRAGSTVLDTLIAALAAQGPPRTGSGCRRWTRRRRWTRCSARRPAPGAGWPRRCAPGRCGCRRPRRPALPAAPRPGGRSTCPARPGTSPSSVGRGRASRPRCATSVLGLALTHTPDELGVHVLDFGGGALVPLVGLPHVGTVADRQQPDLVRRTVAELASVLARRERLFREAGLASVEEFRARRGGGRVPRRAGHRPAARRRRLPHAARGVRRPGGPAAPAGRAGACRTACTSRSRRAAGASCAPR